MPAGLAGKTGKTRSSGSRFVSVSTPLRSLLCRVHRKRRLFLLPSLRLGLSCFLPLRELYF